MNLAALSPETQAAVLRGSARYCLESAEYWLRFDDYDRAIEDLDRATQFFRDANKAAEAAKTKGVFDAEDLQVQPAD